MTSRIGSSSALPTAGRRCHSSPKWLCAAGLGRAAGAIGRMLMHRDIEVDDLDAAGARAVAAGATLAEFQPQDDVRVFLDPAGHPFCLFRPG